MLGDGATAALLGASGFLLLAEHETGYPCIMSGDSDTWLVAVDPHTCSGNGDIRWMAMVPRPMGPQTREEASEGPPRPELVGPVCLHLGPGRRPPYAGRPIYADPKLIPGVHDVNAGDASRERPVSAITISARRCSWHRLWFSPFPRCAASRRRPDELLPTPSARARSSGPQLLLLTVSSHVGLKPVQKKTSWPSIPVPCALCSWIQEGPCMSCRSTRTTARLYE